MTDRLRLAAQAVVDAMDAQSNWNNPGLLAASEALRRALAEPAPCPDGVENCPGDCAGEEGGYKAGVEAALRWSWPDTDDAGIADMVRMVGSK